MLPSRENKNGSGLDNQLLDGVSRSTDVFLGFLSGAAPAPLAAEDLPDNGFPNKSYSIADLPNGGCTVVNPPDCDDDRMESRAFNVR